ncbi:hypothetical protein [Desertivirga brevis]|uniref:hypothetical protein n=1 Tax=Desertivirga brevis TaxID=2810310 RepID=UPI001A972860|nr:hypothetical protein [Pedobacter sp. SYSU D00873]
MRTPVIAFNIEGCFPLIGRGQIIFGEILDGEVSAGDVLNLVIKSKPVKLEIKSVESIRMGEEEKVGLLVELGEDWVALEKHFAFVILAEVQQEELPGN